MGKTAYYKKEWNSEIEEAYASSMTKAHRAIRVLHGRSKRELAVPGIAEELTWDIENEFNDVGHSLRELRHAVIEWRTWTRMEAVSFNVTEQLYDAVLERTEWLNRSIDYVFDISVGDYLYEDMGVDPCKACDVEYGDDKCLTCKDEPSGWVLWNSKPQTYCPDCHGVVGYLGNCGCDEHM